MVRLYIRHRVADYDAWRKVYDDFAGQQQAAGVRAVAVYQSIDDPNDVTVWHDFDDAVPPGRSSALLSFATPWVQAASRANRSCGSRRSAKKRGGRNARARRRCRRRLSPATTRRPWTQRAHDSVTTAPSPGPSSTLGFPSRSPVLDARSVRSARVVSADD
jgi:hypothetical protein